MNEGGTCGVVGDCRGEGIEVLHETIDVCEVANGVDPSTHL